MTQVEEAILSRRLIRRGESMLLAVSGGLDSMALLHVLDRLKSKHQWKITVAHFNHQLRGRSSDADEALVRRWSARLRYPCIVGRGGVKEFAQQNRLSIEMAARKLRHEFLARSARQLRLKTIVLAHHADDQVELFFVRLLRGAGSEGLAGMSWQSPSSADSRLRIVRPLLAQPKSALVRFAEESRISFREDASNALPDMLRNRVRGELIPLLTRRYQPALAKVILRQMDILGAEAEWLGAEAAKWLQRRQPSFDRLSAAWQRQCLRLQLIALGMRADFDIIERLRLASGASITLESSVRIWRDSRGQVHKESATKSEDCFQRDQILVDLMAGPIDVVFGSVKFRWRLKKSGITALPRLSSGREWFDADRIGRIVHLRHWRPGDRFQPIGLKRSTKLQDLFTNAKIPRARRRDLVVATTAAGEIWWVEALRIGEQFKLTSKTERRLCWTWRRLPQTA